MGKTGIKRSSLTISDPNIKDQASSPRSTLVQPVKKIITRRNSRAKKIQEDPEDKLEKVKEFSEGEADDDLPKILKEVPESKEEKEEETLPRIYTELQMICDIEKRPASPIEIDLGSSSDSMESMSKTMSESEEEVTPWEKVMKMRGVPNDEELERGKEKDLEKVVEEDLREELEHIQEKTGKEEEIVAKTKSESKKKEVEAPALIPMEVDERSRKLEELLAPQKGTMRRLPTSTSRAVESKGSERSPAPSTSRKAMSSVESPQASASPDIMLVAGNERKPSCISMLVEHSGYFKKLYSNGVPKKGSALVKHELELPDPTVLALLVKKIKQPKKSVTFQEAQELLYPAIKLEMDVLKDECLQMIMGKVCGENWLKLKSLAMEAKSSDLNRILDQRMDANSSSILPVLLKSKQFLNLTLEELGKLLWKKNLNIGYETVHKMTDAWLAHEKRGEDLPVYAQVKSLELYRDDDLLNLSIFDGKPTPPPTLDMDTPGWVFLQSMVTPKKLVAAFKAYDPSRFGRRLAKLTEPKGTISTEEKVKNRKRMLEVEENDNPKRRNVTGIKQEPLPRIPKLTKTVVSDESKSWDPMGNNNNSSAENDQFGKNGYGEERRTSASGTPRGGGRGRGARPSFASNDDMDGDWGSPPVKKEDNWGGSPVNKDSWGGPPKKDEDSWDTQSSRGGASQDEDWGSKPNSSWGRSDDKPTRGGFSGRGRGRSDGNRSDDGGGDSPWNRKATPWGGKRDENPPGRKSNNDLDDWGSGSTPAPKTAPADDDDWGAPPPPRSRNNSSSKPPNDSSWGSSGGNDSSWGTSGGKDKAGGGGSWGSSGGKDDDSWGSSGKDSGGWGGKDSGSWGDDASSKDSGWGGGRRDSGSSFGDRGRGGGRGRGGDRGGRGGRGGGRGGGGGREARPDDWACKECNFATNFGSRQTCFRCQAEKPGGAGGDFGGGGRGRGGRGGRGGGYSRGGGYNNRNSDGGDGGWGGGSSSTTAAADEDDWDAPTPAKPTTTAPPAASTGDDWDAPAPAQKATAPPAASGDDWDSEPPASVSAPKTQPGKKAEDDWDSTPAAAPSAPKDADEWEATAPPRITAPLVVSAPEPSTPKEDDWGSSKGAPGSSASAPAANNGDEWGDSSANSKPPGNDPKSDDSNLNKGSGARGIDELDTKNPNGGELLVNPMQQVIVPEVSSLDPRLQRRTSQEPKLPPPPPDVPPEQLGPEHIPPPPIVKQPWTVSRIDGVNTAAAKEYDLPLTDMNNPEEGDPNPKEIPTETLEEGIPLDPRKENRPGTLLVNGTGEREPVPQAPAEVPIPIPIPTISAQIDLPAPPPSVTEEEDGWD